MVYLVFKYIIFIFSCCCLVKSNELSVDQQDHFPDIPTVVLDYLNNDPKRLYEYKEGSIISAHQKADIIELNLDVRVDCLYKIPELPCPISTLHCDGFLQIQEDNTSKALRVHCEQKPDVINKQISSTQIPNIPPPIPVFEPTVQVNNVNKISLSNETVSAVSGEEFVAVHNDTSSCLGCTVEVNVDATGITELVNAALHHVDSEKNRTHVLIKVIRAQQQVDSAIKYTLILEIAPTICTTWENKDSKNCPRDPTLKEVVCEIKYLQQPWKSKHKNIVGNNCTIVQNYIVTDVSKVIKTNPNDLSNEIGVLDNYEKAPHVKPDFRLGDDDFNKMAEGGSLNLSGRDADILSELESQIIQEMIEPTSSKSTEESRPTSVEFSSRNEVGGTERNERPIVSSSSFQEVFATEDKPVSLGTDTAITSDVPSDPKKSDIEVASSPPVVVSSTRANMPVSTVDVPHLQLVPNQGETKVTTKETSSEESSETPQKHRSVKRIPRAATDFEKVSIKDKPFIMDLANFVASTLDNIDDDNHKRVVLQIISARKKKSEELVYHLVLRIGVSRCDENAKDDDANCKKDLYDNLTKICRVEVHNGDKTTTPKVIKSHCQNIKKDHLKTNRTYNFRRRRALVGGWKELRVDDPRILTFTADTVKHLDTKTAYKNRHTVNEIVSASSQVVAGVKYKIGVKLDVANCIQKETSETKECVGDSTAGKTCEIVVWDRAWLNQTITDVKCDNGNYKTSFETHSNRVKRDTIPGGIVDQPNDNVKARDYLRDTLVSLDADSGKQNKLKIKEILAVSKQIVAGEKWRIKAKVIESDCLKSDSKLGHECNELDGASEDVCDFTIWVRPWLKEHARQNEVQCQKDTRKQTFRKKREVNVLGGEVDWHADNSKVMEFVKDGLSFLDSQSPHENKYKLKEILSVTKQTVSGQLWRIKFVLTLSDCAKTAPEETEKCGDLQNGKTKLCDIRVYDKPWLVVGGRNSEITCQDESGPLRFEPNRTVSHRHNLGQDDHDVYFLLFREFMQNHKKVYGTRKEHRYRLGVFRQNMKTVDFLNKHEQGTAKYEATKFADLTPKEFSKMLGYRADLREENNVELPLAETPDVDLPDEFDWRTKGAVTGVKDQGSCGSCWAFSVTGNVEGQNAIKHGQLLSFSEQELVDCDKVDDGCNGGLMDTAYRVIEKLGGLETESAYPYDAEDEKCHLNKSLIEVKLSGAVNISQDETDMAKWLVKNGPISIAINANAMQFYAGGVSHPWKFTCNPKNLDHGVLIVGYGVHTYPKFKKSLPYWIVKNSWGTSWGEQGYYRVYRGDGTCGVNQTPSSAIVV